MDTLAGFFGGNPFATPVGHKIEEATDASLPTENWALNMEICDMINETEDGAKDAVKAIKRRLQQNAAKNYSVVMYTLTVLETCVKNCSRQFLALVCSKDFIQDLVKMIGSKNDPPVAIQEKVLGLIQSWADAFKHQPDLQGVVHVYQDLKGKGIEFPMTDLDNMAPILTPQRTTSEQPPYIPPQMDPVVPAVPFPEMIDVHDLLQPQTLDSNQLSKLQNDLAIVEVNMSVFSEMLADLTPGQEHPADLDLLRELHSTCRGMQERLVQLLDRVANDEVTAHLLKLNDDLNNLFLRYERYEKNSNAAKSEVKQVSPLKPADEGPALIDLGDDDSGLSASAQSSTLPVISANFERLNINGGNTEENEFDMFAQARTTAHETSRSNPSPYADPDQLDTSLAHVAQQRQQEGGLFGNDPFKGEREEDFEHMEAWLQRKPLNEADSLSPEMNQYLQRRWRSQGKEPETKKPENDDLFSL